MRILSSGGPTTYYNQRPSPLRAEGLSHPLGEPCGPAYVLVEALGVQDRWEGGMEEMVSVTVGSRTAAPPPPQVSVAAVTARPSPGEAVREETDLT